ncbi:HAMP domain-containing methyl-accepting chemotaxis protein [Marinomonas sp.]|uniref:HAMP domain-containing methyl-accepting chemotaxis protein n=1 Tax=Marinomonas sp. TaxID=1904862 RepID=UPI003BAA8A4B
MKKFLENRQIGTKLGLGFGTVLILLLIVGAAGTSGVYSLLDRAKKVKLANNLDDTVVDIQIARKDLFDSGTDEHKATILNLLKQLDSILQDGQSLYTGKDAIALVKNTKEDLDSYKKTLIELTETQKKWTAIDVKADGFRNNIFEQYDIIIAKLRQNSDRETLSQALDVSRKMYAFIFTINEYINSKQNIPLDLVLKDFQNIIDSTKALQLPSDLQTNQQKVLSLLDQYAELGKSNPVINSALTEKRQELMMLSSNMNDNIDALTVQQEKKSVEDSQQVITVLLSVTAIAIFLGIFFAMLIRNVIVKPTHEVMNAVKKIAEGDLTQTLKTDRKDELGLLYNTIGEMSVTLNKLISEVVSGVLNLSSTSEQLEAISKQGQKMMLSQKDETDQVATAINEMLSTVAEVARNTEIASEATTETEKMVSQGNQIVTNTVSSTESLAKNLGITSEAMAHLKERTDNVGNVLEVIKSVAEQTNLLALNAAIEAARAGEAGRGFAVVADEVRGLASRTQSSAKEIEDLIIELQSGAQESLDNMLKSRDSSNDNATKAKEVLDLFSKISEKMSSIQDMGIQIATASEEQSQVSEEINKNVENVRQLADKTADDSMESVKAVSNLRTLSHQLKSLTDRFKI